MGVSGRPVELENSRPVVHPSSLHSLEEGVRRVLVVRGVPLIQLHVPHLHLDSSVPGSHYADGPVPLLNRGPTASERFESTPWAPTRAFSTHATSEFSVPTVMFLMFSTSSLALGHRLAYVA